jgi:ATP-dependent DNA helicase RecQ
LRGVPTERIVSAQHERIPAFGIGAASRKEEWHSLIRQLVAGGWLDIDIAGYGSLSVSSRGSALLRGAEEFRYKPLAKLPRARVKAAETKAVPATGDDPLLVSLKALRLRLAKERHLPAYLIFPDRTLLEMAAKRPRNAGELSRVSGVGAAKLEQFGDAFLAAIANDASDARV